MIQSNRLKIRRLLILPMLLGCLSDQTFGLEPVAVLAPNDLPPGFTNDFGRSVAISGDTIVVGAPYDGFSGAAYVFQRIGPNWVEQAKLKGNPSWSKLGWTVDIDGDVVVAGAPYLDWPCDIGVVFVFRRNNQGTPDDPSDDTWAQDGRFIDPEFEVDNGFGSSVAVSGDAIVVGNCRDRAYVFRYSQGNWDFETTLTSPDPQSYQGFGYDVDVDENRTVIGAPYADDARGAAYVFSFSENQWESEGILTVTDSQPGDGLGRSLAIHGDRIVSGAIGVDEAGFQSNSGAAYVFQREPEGGWELQQKLAPSLVRRSAQFGSASSMDNDLVLNAGTVNSPGPFLFERFNDQWVEADTLSSPLTYPSIDIDGKFAIFINRVYVVRERRNIRDFGTLQNCFGLDAENGMSMECQVFDLKGDGQLDFSDFGEFMATLGGP